MSATKNDSDRRWVTCPICGELGIRNVIGDGEPLITFMNHACASNSGRNFDAVKHSDLPPTQVDLMAGVAIRNPATELRDRFAGLALAGQIQYEGIEGCEKEHVAAMCYELADAMLLEREKGKV